MDAQALLNSLHPDQLAALKAAVDGLTDTSGRSPIRPRQLHDLRIAPRADDPRPTFFWSAEAPRNAADLTKTTPYPRLMWDVKSGKEVTVTDAAAQASYTAKGFVLTAPSNAEKPPMESVRDLLDGLSETDRQLVLKGAHQVKLEQIQAQVLKLSDEERAELAAALEPAKAKRTA